LRALEKARTLGVTTLGFSSENGRLTMEPFCDLGLYVPSKDTARIQESHLFLWHFICGCVEEKLFPGGKDHAWEKETGKI
jgi:D-sedoheptulose 7-phosphate isomerase